MTLSDPFLTQLLRAWPTSTWQDVNVLVAVSGGPDSVALLCAMVSAADAGSGGLIAAHYNHGTRGPESDADADFVQNLCQRLGVLYVTGRGRPVSQTHGNGPESQMRDARYGFLVKAAEEHGARYVVTAHTADDQAETILHRIVRGTGLTGLAGIPRVRELTPAVSVVRPMLAIRRSEVFGFLQRLSQPSRNDASNADLGFTRNRIRHELLPDLKANYNREVVDALLKLGRLADESQQVIGEQVEKLCEQCVCYPTSDVARVDCEKLAGCPSYMVRQLLIHIWREQAWPRQAMGFDQWTLLSSMIMAPSTGVYDQRVTLPGHIVMRREDAHLILARQSR